MKHRLTALFPVLLLLLTMTACAAAGETAAPDAGQVQLEQKLDALEQKLDALEDSLEKALPQAAPAAPQKEPAAAASPAPEKAPAAAETQPASGQDNKLSREEAEKIALDHVGFTADQVERLRTEFEMDDGMPQYDVEFLQGDWEYEFEIHAEDGRIISFDKDHKFD